MIKQNLKSFLWASVTTIGFFSLIIATLGIGFHSADAVNTWSLKLNDLLDMRMGIYQDISGLWVTSLLFMAIIMALTITKLVLEINNKQFLYINEKIWDWGLIGSIGFITILMVAGISTGIDHLKTDGGYDFALFLFTFIPPLLTLIPMLLGNKKMVATESDLERVLPKN